MNKFAAILFSIAILMLGGCAPAQNRGEESSAMTSIHAGRVVIRTYKPCSGGTTCQPLDFTLTCFQSACKLEVPEPIVVQDSQGRKTVLLFQLPDFPPGLQFDTSAGILFETDKIPCGPIGSKGKIFKCVDGADYTPDGDPGYKYSVTVKWRGESFSIPALDPWVVNH